MAQKYYLEYYDTENIIHRLEIDGPDETLGTEIIINGSFNSSTGWGINVGWTIANGVATALNTTGYISQTPIFLNGKTYEVTYTVTELTLGVSRVLFEAKDLTSQGLATQTTVGTFTERITMTKERATVRFGATSISSSYVIDNVSIKEVIPAPPPQEIRGNVIQKYTSSKNSLTPIRGSGLTINLEADIDLTFEDLYSEQERTYSVTYLRNGIITFNGWIDPEGLFQDFVRDKWLISLQCVDGLGFLNNLSFVNPLTFQLITGKQKELDIMAVCLKRTSVLQNINTAIGITYDGLDEALNVLENTYLNANRFIKDDNKTIMNCKEVLNDLLEPYGACIASVNGEWYVYKPNELYFNNNAVTFFRYDSEGVVLAPPTKTVDLSETLGSQVNGFYPHHAQANQQIEVQASIGAYRVEYSYGVVKSLITNNILTNIGGVLADWTIIDPAPLTLPPSGESGVFVLCNSDGAGINTVLESYHYTVDVGLSTTLTVVVGSESSGHFSEWGKMQVVLIQAAAPNKTYYYGDGAWHDSSPQIIKITSLGRTPSTLVNTIDIAETPFEGDIFVRLLQPYFSATNPPKQEYTLISLNPAETQGENSPKGEMHTFQRTSKPSSKIGKSEEVFNGDNPSDVWVGTIYKNDQITPTEFWHRKGLSVTDFEKPYYKLWVKKK